MLFRRYKRLAQWFLPVSVFLVSIQFAAGAQTSTPSPASAYRGGLRAYLGVFIGDALAAKGAVVGKVVEDSPAAKAGLRVNDLIQSFGQTPIENAAHVYKLLGELPPGSGLTITVLRGETTRALQVTLGERQGPVDPCLRLYAEADLHQAEANRLRQLAEAARQKGNEEEAKARLAEAGSNDNRSAELRADVDKAIREGKVSCGKSAPQTRGALGLNAMPLTEQLAQFFNVKTGAGVLVTEVKPDGLAARQGLQAGDCLLTINGNPVATLAEAQRLLNPESALEISLLIVRDGKEQTLKGSL